MPRCQVSHSEHKSYGWGVWGHDKDAMSHCLHVLIYLLTCSPVGCCLLTELLNVRFVSVAARKVKRPLPFPSSRSFLGKASIAQAFQMQEKRQNKGSSTTHYSE